MEALSMNLPHVGYTVFWNEPYAISGMKHFYYWFCSVLNALSDIRNRTKY